MLGELLFPLVSLSVGILLFEGGLGLRFRGAHPAGSGPHRPPGHRRRGGHLGDRLAGRVGVRRARRQLGHPARLDPGGVGAHRGAATAPVRPGARTGEQHPALGGDLHRPRRRHAGHRRPRRRDRERGHRAERRAHPHHRSVGHGRRAGRRRHPHRAVRPALGARQPAQPVHACLGRGVVRRRRRGPSRGRAVRHHGDGRGPGQPAVGAHGPHPRVRGGPGSADPGRPVHRARRPHPPRPAGRRGAGGHRAGGRAHRRSADPSPST